MAASELEVTASAPRESADKLYQSMVAERQPYLDRARDVAKLTIPTLLPPEGSNGSTKFYTPFQGTGARGVNNIASKLLLALFPPNRFFARLTMDEKVLAELEKAAGPDQDVRGEVNTALATLEQRILTDFNESNSRPVLFQALRHLAIGNVFLREHDDGSYSYLRLDSYVVRRDGTGNVILAITKECIDKEALPDQARAFVESLPPGEAEQSGKRDIDLYTVYRRNGKKFDVHQEIKGHEVFGTKGTQPIDRTSFQALRFNHLSGEHYGRGLAEELIGDLASLESLMQSLVEGSAAAAKVIWLLNPGGVTLAEKVAKAVNGEFVEGDVRDIAALKLDKSQDFSIVLQTIQSIEKRLDAAFLNSSAIQRNAERVTAEEIRFLANELENAYGGLYSILAQELQRPLAVRRIFQMKKRGLLPSFNDKLIKPTIVTGIEALGRTDELQRLDAAIQGTAQDIGPEMVAKYLKPGGLFRRRFASLSVPDIDQLVRTDEEVAQADQQAQLRETAMKLGPTALKAGMDAQQQAAQPQQ